MHRATICTVASAVTAPNAAMKGVHPCNPETAMVSDTAGVEVLSNSSCWDMVVKKGEQFLHLIVSSTCIDVVTVELVVLSNCVTGSDTVTVQGKHGVANGDDEVAMLEVAAPAWESCICSINILNQLKSS